MLPLCLIVADDGGGGGGGGVVAPQPPCDFDNLGFKPYTVRDVASALGLVDQWHFDAVLVDAGGQIESSLQLLPALRERCQAPIVLLSSEAGERSQIEALQGGATEVIVKPASAQLIAAKLHRLVDIARGHADAIDDKPSVVSLGPLSLDPRRSRASIGTTALPLTGGEFELLLLLASRPGEFVHRETIARTLGAAGVGRRSADMHVCRIRKKLRESGALRLRLETVYGRGYCLRLYEHKPEDAGPGGAARTPQWST